MKWHIKLSGENIMGHVDARHPDFNPLDYDEIVHVDRLSVHGKYIYKFSGGSLVALTPQEILDHPLAVDNEAGKKVEQAFKLILRRMACDEVIGTSAAPQRLKDKAQDYKTQATQDLVNLLGL